MGKLKLEQRLKEGIMKKEVPVESNTK